MNKDYLEENRIDGINCGKSELKTYNAHKDNVSCRLEAHDPITHFLKVCNRTADFQMKVDYHELCVMRAVLNKWFEDLK